MKFLTSLKPDYKTMRFKAMIICALFCNSAILVIAQNKSDRYHEFGSVKGWQLNGYIGPLIALSSVAGSFSINLGATGGFIINNDFFTGI